MQKEKALRNIKINIITKQMISIILVNKDCSESN